MQQDNLALIASGVAFYAFLAMVPLLGAVVMSYGLIADTKSVMAHFKELSTMLPPDAARLIGEQLMNVVTTSGGKKGIGLIIALVLAFWGATKATGAIVVALNIAYEEEETRGFVRRTALNLAMVVGAVVAVGLAMMAITVFAHLDTLLPGLPGFVLFLGRLVSWVVLAMIGAGGVAMLYRYGPDREAAKWRWLSPGSIAASLGWGALTVGFGIYVANFGNYNAAYGSLGAVVVLLTWLYLSALVLLLGAELNAELEHQTERDTTSGAERPLGARRAEMADRVAPDGDEPRSVPPSPQPLAKVSDDRQTILPFDLKFSEAVLILMLALLPRRSTARSN